MKLVTLIKNALTLKPYTDKVTNKQRAHYCINVETSIMGMTVSEMTAAYNNKRKTQKKKVNAVDRGGVLSQADRYNIERMTFELSFYDYVKVISTGKCYYTGKNLTKTDYSVDRVDPRRSYVAGNVVLSLPEFNSFKGSLFDKLLHEDSPFSIDVIEQVSSLKYASQLPTFSSLGRRAKAFHAFIKSSEVFCAQKANGGSL